VVQAPHLRNLGAGGSYRSLKRQGNLEATLVGSVDVLVGRLDAEGPVPPFGRYLVQSLADLKAFVSTDQTGAGQSFGIGLATLFGSENENQPC